MSPSNGTEGFCGVSASMVYTGVTSRGGGQLGLFWILLHAAAIVRVRPAMVGNMDSVLINGRKNQQKFASRIEAGR